MVCWRWGRTGKRNGCNSLPQKHPAVPPARIDNQQPLSLHADKTYTSVTIALSLISHTNVGKTTLARTLLGRDIGEVRDAEHVTHTAERHVWSKRCKATPWSGWSCGTPPVLVTANGWPSASRKGNRLGWFMSEVWDRIQNRDFWFSQRAVRNILDEPMWCCTSSMRLKAPQEVAYLDAELKVLDLIGKPVIVLLNQLGPPPRPSKPLLNCSNGSGASQSPCVKDVLLLDAFTRCWVQEGRLMQAVAQALPISRQG